jgi:hypothetical protein
LAVAIALLVMSGCAGQEASETVTQEQEPVTIDTPTPEQIAPHEMTCAEIRDMFLAEEYEEEASHLAAWAYGLQTGAGGMDFEKYPVTMAGLEDFVTRVILTCKANPDQLFVDAILE